MDFRIVSIAENPGFGNHRALKLELRSVSDIGSESTITAYVPNSGVFQHLTIGAILNFGDNRLPAYEPNFDPAREGHWKSPEVHGIPPTPKSGYFTYDLGKSTTRIVDNPDPLGDYNPGSSSTGLPPGGCTSSSINTEEPKPSENWIGPGSKKTKR